MPTITFDVADAVELAEILYYLADWLDTMADYQLKRLPLDEREIIYPITTLRADLTRLYDALRNSKISP